MTSFKRQNTKDQTLEIYQNNFKLVPVARFKINGTRPVIEYGNCSKDWYLQILGEKTDYNLCELICFPSRMYFDYDSKVELTPEQVRRWSWDDTIDNIKQMLRVYFPKIKLNISGSISLKKLSLHIVMSRTVIRNREENDIFQNFVLEVLKKQNPAFDTSVYSRDRLMKSINQSKNDGRVQSWISGNKDKLERHMINLYDTDTTGYKNVNDFKLQDYSGNNTESDDESVCETKGEVYNEFVDAPKTKRIKFLQEICDLINIEYIDNYSSWIKIIYSLRSIGPETQDLCFYVSMKSRKYDANAGLIINDIYAKFENKGITEGTLHYYSKKGNEKEYYKVINKHYIKLTLNTHYGHSQELHKTIGNDYRFYKDGTIYRFNGIFWETLDNLDDVEKDIRFKYSSYFMDQYLNEEDIDIKKELKKICNNLGTKSFTLAVAQTYKQNHQIQPIEMETEPYLFVFKNMIFDLRTGLEIEPSPDYNCVMNTGYNYVEPTDEEMAEINRHFDLIFPNPEIREGYKYLLATSLFGYRCEKFIISNGCGGNGKSMLMSILSKMMGEADTGYAYTLQSSSLLQPLSMGANTEIAKINNKRFTICSEPSNGGCLDNSTIKELTGEDKINARKIYSTNTEVYVKHTLFMMCNNKPALKETPTRGDSRRLLDIPFDALFVSEDELQEKIEEQEQGINIDKTYHVGNNKYAHTDYKRKMRCALFNMLLPYAKRFHEADYNIDTFIPKIIKDRSDEYIAEQDLIYEYVKEFYDRVGGDNYIKVNDIFEKIKYSGKLREFSGTGKELLKKDLVLKCKSSMGLARDYEKHKRGLPRNILLGWRLKDECGEDEDELD
jgi:P4 family phage/plasmid primase-like protien